MKKIIKLTEGQLNNIIKRVINEQEPDTTFLQSETFTKIYEEIVNYVMNKIQETNDTDLNILIPKLKNLSINDFTNAREYFLTLKLNKNEISNLQREFKVESFTNTTVKDGKHKFEDGVIGAATAVVVLNKLINVSEGNLKFSKLNKLIPPTNNKAKEFSKKIVGAKEGGRKPFTPTRQNINVDFGQKR